jgi:DNA repair protein RadC
MKIKNWSEEDRPREKLVSKGKAALSDAELVAILLGSGTVSLTAVDLAKTILQHVHYNLHELAKLSVHDLQKFKGIGQAKAITIVSALELGKRRKESKTPERIKITSSKHVFELMLPLLMDLPHEECWVLLLNKANYVISKKQMSRGGTDGTMVDPKLVFKLAVEELAHGVILIHNHPSGNLKPSEADRRITNKMKEYGQVTDIPLLDHLIVTNEDYLSFADEGLV